MRIVDEIPEDDRARAVLICNRRTDWEAQPGARLITPGPSYSLCSLCSEEVVYSETAYPFRIRKVCIHCAAAALDGDAPVERLIANSTMTRAALAEAQALLGKGGES